jgi:uncharacterized membrane protein
LKLKEVILTAIAALSIGTIIYAATYIYSLYHPPAEFQYQDNYFAVVHFGWLLIIAIAAAMILCLLLLNFLIRKREEENSLYFGVGAPRRKAAELPATSS